MLLEWLINSDNNIFSTYKNSFLSRIIIKMKLLTFFVLFYLVTSYHAPKELDDSFLGKKKSGDANSINQALPNKRRPIEETKNEVAMSDVKKSEENNRENIIKEKNDDDSLKQTNSNKKDTDIKKSENSEDIDEILNKLTNGKEENKKKVYFISNTRIELFDYVNTDGKDCAEEFKEKLYFWPTFMFGYGNSGYLSICSKKKSKMAVFHHGRIETKKGNFNHNEEDIFNFLKEIDLNEKQILFSSFFSPCYECQDKIQNFLIQKPNTVVKLFFWKDYFDKTFNEKSKFIKTNNPKFVIEGLISNQHKLFSQFLTKNLHKP